MSLLHATLLVMAVAFASTLLVLGMARLFAWGLGLAWRSKAPEVDADHGATPVEDGASPRPPTRSAST